MECPIEWPYEQFRRGQREVSEEIAATVKEGGVLSLTAPTGFGKTPAILYGVLCSGAEKVLYLVRTVNEVDPVLRELNRLGADYTFIYSARRMCPLLRGDNGELTSEEFWGACRIARLQGLCDYYTRLEEVDVYDLSSTIRSLRESRSKRIVSFLSRQLQVCPFFALRGLLDKSQVIVATYPYFFRPDIFSSVLDPYDYSDFVVVVDEAHSLINAHSMMERRLTIEDIEKAIDEVRRYSSSPGIVVDLLEGLSSTLKAMGRMARRKVELGDKEKLSEILDELNVVSDVAEEVREKKLEEAILQGSRTAKSFITRVEAWLQALSQDYILLFIEPPSNNSGPVFVASPVDPAVVTREPLEKAKAVILASGTLPKGDYVRELLGVERRVKYIDTDLLFGPYIPPANIYTVVARNVTTRYSRRTPEMYRALASYVALIARSMPGAKLAVYPSYEVMENIVNKIPAGLPLIIERRGTNIADVEAKLLESPDLLINAVAGGKLVEGVEFKIDGENLLTTVIVVGVPYPQPDAYTHTMLSALTQRLGRQKARYYVYTFNPVVKVKQALGRATRGPEDRAAYFLLDHRYLYKDIRELLRLRYNRIVASITDLAAAIREARKIVKGRTQT